jgi:methionine-rich copper-binding protein CopC
MNWLWRILFFCLVLFLSASRMNAHAFLERSDPPVGSKLHSAPTGVRIQFTEAIEPRLSSIQVFDTTGKQVDKKDTHSDPSDRSVLQVSLPRLGAGTYKVLWRIVSVDTHRTNGDFTFQVLP